MLKSANNSKKTILNIIFFFATVLLYNALFFNVFELNRNNAKVISQTDTNEYDENLAKNFGHLKELPDNVTFLNENCKLFLLILFSKSRSKIFCFKLYFFFKQDSLSC